MQREYEFAKRNGYNGSYDEYLILNYKSYCDTCIRCDVAAMTFDQWKAAKSIDEMATCVLDLERAGYRVQFFDDGSVVVKDPVMVNGRCGAEYRDVRLTTVAAVRKFLRERS